MPIYCNGIIIKIKYKKCKMFGKCFTQKWETKVKGILCNVYVYPFQKEKIF